MLELSDDVKRILITADTFSLKGNHPQLTPSVVLTFILEEFSEKFKSEINNFFIIKHSVLKKALRHEDGDNSGERYTDKLVMCLYKCKQENGKVEIDNLTKHLINIFTI